MADLFSVYSVSASISLASFVLLLREYVVGVSENPSIHVITFSRFLYSKKLLRLVSSYMLSLFLFYAASSTSLGAMLMVMSSWKSSLAAYGMRTWETVEFLHDLHSKWFLAKLAIANSPHASHT
jgi:hypothetical protein